MAEGERKGSYGWEPLLDGELRAKAWDTAAAIAADLAGIVTRPGDLAGIEEGPSRDATLGGGDAGLALFFHYLASCSSDFPDALRLRDICVARAAESLSAQAMGPSLFSGLVGICWALDHIFSATGPDTQDSSPGEDPLSEVDRALYSYTANSPADHLDFIDGLAGTGIYLLARGRRPHARDAVANIVRIMDEVAERDGPHVSWRVPFQNLDADDQVLYPLSRYDLGVAHGVPGIAAFLARAWAAGVEPELAGGLLTGAVQWLLAQAPADRASPRFPYWVAPVGPMPMTRVAWCYGDLGIASSLLAIASLTRRDDWWRYSLDLARQISTRPQDRAEMVDFGLCHGTASAAHLLNRAFHLSRDIACRDAARFWFAQTLHLRNAGRGIGGYMSLIKDANMQDLWIADAGFLNGAAGIGLAVLAALTDVEPAWDSILVASSLDQTGGKALIAP